MITIKEKSKNLTVLQKEDIPRLVELVLEYKRAIRSWKMTCREIEVLFERCLEASSTVTMLCKNETGEIQGFISFHIIPFPILGGMELYISDLLVSEKERGNGIGKALLTSTYNYARQHDCSRIMLLNPKHSMAYTQGFYTGNGFLEREDFANFIKKI